jgi:hypothetical protein
MSIKVDIKRDPTIDLNAKRSLDGNIMIFDHEDIDIVLMVEKNKCLTFPKEEASDKVYYSQDKMFRFLVKRGVVDPGTIRGGNIYGSMEASILESQIPGVESIQAVLYSLHEFIKEERPYFLNSAEYESDRLDHLLRPSDEYSTDLGEVPHSANKGAMDSRVRPYGFRYNYSLIREEREDK